MRKVQPKQYKKLRPGAEYTFKIYDLKGHRMQKGFLIDVTTRWQDKKDEEGKVTGRVLVGDRLEFKPVGGRDHDELFGERVPIFSTTVGRGLFEVFVE